MKGWTNAHPVKYKGVTYASYAACGRAFGQDPAIVKRRLALHQPLEVHHIHQPRSFIHDHPR